MDETLENKPISGKRPTDEKSPLLPCDRALDLAESLTNVSVIGPEIRQGVSWGMAAFLLVNTALGAGMLNYPYAYNQIGGVWAAALMQVILLFFVTSTMFILVYCADFNRDNTYHDVLLSMCGKRAQQISALSILLTCYGINITFLVIIGDQYDRIFNSLMTPEQLEASWFMDRKFTIFITATLFIWPMCYAQRLDFLRHASVLGMFAMLYVAFLTVYEHYKLDEPTIEAIMASRPQHGLVTNYPNATNSKTTGAQAGPKHLQWFEPLAIVPVLCFAYQTHEVIIPVYACMRDRFIGDFMKASIFGLVILFFLYNLVGAFGFLTFGDDVGADIMSLYDAKDPVVVVGIVALVIKFVTTYPPLMFCGRSALEGLYGEIRKLSASEFKSGEKMRRYVITTIWFITSVSIAAFAPDISVTLQLLGSMASINVFVFPGMCLISLTGRLRRARLTLLMGEIPNNSFKPTNCISRSQQRAKEYYLISGSYFGSAARKDQCGQQQMQQLSSNNCCNPNCANSNANNQNITNPKHFTTTFASLIEFENNLQPATSTTVTPRIGNGDGNERQTGNFLNGRGSGSGGTGEILSSISSSTASTFSNPSSASLIKKHNLINGVGSGSSVEQVQRQVQRRQDEFERLITNGSFCNCCCCCCGPSSTVNNSLSRDYHYKYNPVGHGKTINDSYDDYSDCIDHEHQHGRHNHHYYQYQNRLSHQAHDLLVSHQSQQQPKLMIDESFGQTTVNNHLFVADQLQDKSMGAKTSKSCASHHYQKHSQCLQSNSLNNYCQLSTTGSLLDKLGSTIAPSTVAQIGIAKCTAVTLYLYSALLIVFGVFIFVLELVNVFGLL